MTTLQRHGSLGASNTAPRRRTQGRGRTDPAYPSVAEADFLAEPSRGSDAYVSDGQYMAAMVSTFDGADLMMVDDAAAE